MAVQVTLSPEYDEALRKQVFSTIKDAVTDARQKTGIDSPWLPSKNAAAKWLGVSVNTLSDLMREGLPCHIVHNKYYFEKTEITKYILNN